MSKAKLKKLEDYRDEIRQCVKCGACRAHCPVFGAEKHEGMVARGKIALSQSLLDGDVEMKDKFLLDMSQCLLCGSCCDQCPNKVPTEEIVAAARREISEKKGLSTFGKGVSTVLKSQGLMKGLAKSAGTFSSLLFKKLPENSGLRLRLPLPFIDHDRTLRRLQRKHFASSTPNLSRGRKGSRPSPSLPVAASTTSIRRSAKRC